MHDWVFNESFVNTQSTAPDQQGGSILSEEVTNIKYGVK